MRPARLIRSAIVLKPSTLLNLHRALRNRKYHILLSSKRRNKPGPKGPAKENHQCHCRHKRTKSIMGCLRIAQQVSLAFGISIDKGHSPARPGRPLPARAAFLRPFLADIHRPPQGQSLEYRPVRCESAILQTHWILIVMDQYTRRIIGFGFMPERSMELLSAGCSRRVIADHRTLPKHLSSIMIRSFGLLNASQSQDPRDRRNQGSPLRSPFSSVH